MIPSDSGKSPDGTPYRVLIIDDSAFVIKQLGQILTSVGFQVVGSAEDGVIGVATYKKLFPKVDLVTMDITMPKMDGLTSLEKIIEFDTKARVVMCSALGKQDLVKDALLKGAKNFVIKPFDREKVLERLISVLGT